jgi:hypothetical protein
MSLRGPPKSRRRRTIAVGFILPLVRRELKSFIQETALALHDLKCFIRPSL